MKKIPRYHAVIFLAPLSVACSRESQAVYPAAVECTASYSAYLAVAQRLSGDVPNAGMMKVGASLWQQALEAGHANGKTEAQVANDVDEQSRLLGERLDKEQPTAIPDHLSTRVDQCLADLRKTLPSREK